MCLDGKHAYVKYMQMRSCIIKINIMHVHTLTPTILPYVPFYKSEIKNIGLQFYTPSPWVLYRSHKSLITWSNIKFESQMVVVSG